MTLPLRAYVVLMARKRGSISTEACNATAAHNGPAQRFVASVVLIVD
jgi:hypothetical protein